MNIDIKNIQVRSLSIEQCDARDTLVVIDVFRAFTTAAVALKNGARAICMVNDVVRALSLRDEIPQSLSIGERRGLKLPGFDHGNSPAEIDVANVSGKTIILTTSNGTRGLAMGVGAGRIYAASLVNAKATADAIMSGYGGGDIILLPMGNDSETRTDEDELCALYLRALLLGIEPDAVSLTQYIRGTANQIHRIDGRDEPLSHNDLEMCLNVNFVNLAIRVRYDGGHLVASGEESFG